MSLDGAYEIDNVFARILRDELPSARVFEDEHTLAFLDAFPQCVGHTLVISKWSRGRNVLEIEPAALCQVMTTVQRIARALRTVLSPDGIHVAQFNGGDTGQTVFHLHVHVLPRWKDRDLQLLQYYVPGVHADPDEQRALAGRLAAAC